MGLQVGTGLSPGCAESDPKDKLPLGYIKWLGSNRVTLVTDENIAHIMPNEDKV